MAIDKLKVYISQKVSIYPLVGFRILYGLLLLFSAVRFMANGWVQRMYIEPLLHFNYWGFEWVKPLPGEWMYLPFVLMCIAALGILLGYYYRQACVLFFLCFTYVELIDSTNYLNHYYFISLLTFLMFWVPADHAFAWRRKNNVHRVPNYYLLIIKAQIALVYLFAGIAKLEPHWLFQAMPLRIWLPAHHDLPLIGEFMNLPWLAYIFSWFGCVYDLIIPFLLFHPRYNIWAFAAVIVFHGLTAALFPIGVFPYVMIASATIFLPEHWFEKLLRPKSILPETTSRANEILVFAKSTKRLLFLFFTLQILIPFRWLCYEGKHLWTEQGYRFSWRVMLVEKAGSAFFYALDADGHKRVFDNSRYLTYMQEKQMSFQPDMMVCYARFLKNLAEQEGIKNPTIHAQVYVTMNGQGSRLYIDESVDLSAQSNSIFKNKSYILPPL